MTFIKLGLFILMTAFTIFLSYIWFDESQNSGNIGGGDAVIIIFFIAILLLVLAIITWIILLKAPKNYSFVFFGMWALAFIGLFVYTVIESYQEHQEHVARMLENEEEEQIEKMWAIMKNNPQKAYIELSSLKTNYEGTARQTVAIYFALSLENKKYQKVFEENMFKHQKRAGDVIHYFLEHYTLVNENQYLKVLKILEKEESIEYIIPYEKRKDFTFEMLINKKYYQASIKILNLKKINQHHLQKYLKDAQRIEDTSYRKKAIEKILKRTQIYKQDWNKVFTITALSPTVLRLQKEEEFPLYLRILKEKLTESDSEKWEVYKNQPAQEVFIEMYTLLGASHFLMEAIPFIVKKYYLAEEEKILKYGKKNYILYRNYMAQVEGDVTHSHAYTDEPYTILIDGKVVHKGLTNDYGCMEYKYYGAKPDDKIEIQTYVGIGGVQNVGWVSLLRSWKTAQGMLDRIAGIGFTHYPPESVDDYVRRFQNRYGIDSNESFNDENMQKAKELFNEFMDEKWCQDTESER